MISRTRSAIFVSIKDSNYFTVKQKFVYSLGLIFSITFLSISATLALEPPTKEQIEQYKKDGTWEQRVQAAYGFGNHIMDPELVQRLNYKLHYLYLQSQGISAREIESSLAPPPAWQGMPSTGAVNIFVLLIEFNDKLHISPADDQPSVDTKVFDPENTGSGSYPYESLKAYYQRTSYNLLNFQGATLGWYKTAYNRSTVSETQTGRENLLKEALNTFNSSHDFSVYDNDGDGDIDYFAVIWTGEHGAWATFWWGYQTWFSDGSYVLDGKTLGKYSWQWESYYWPSGLFSPLVLIHETGHALGLPDY
ncbi:hypothetical protein ACFL27_04575 [candidate division CSSED10-310 bacterium]|uniref:Peptidase M6-like domain-containing protein n=1 Tax=candidate division CSSED10-310 bacterium TaxID=2855610 RepID=A0ABV6YTF7_UNCC1